MQAAAEPTSNGPIDADELRRRVAAIDWYHTQALAKGIETDGMFDLRPYVNRYGLPADLSGMRVLDVGTFEGFWAFELERRGAEVVALDVDRLQQLDWPPALRPSEDSQRGEGFALARQALGSEVERVGMTVYEVDAERLGSFDLIFIGSVTIHLRDPIGALERLACVCRGRLIFADEYSRKLSLLPYPAAEFRGHTPWMTWWRPSIRGWVSMLETAGFERVRRHGRFKMSFSKQSGNVPHVVLHADGPADLRT